MVQGAQIAEDYQSDTEVQEAKVSADMVARVAAVTALSQLAQLASQQSQLPEQPTVESDAHHAGAYHCLSLAFASKPLPCDVA